MNNGMTGVALILAVAAIGVASFAIVENRALRQELEARDLLSESGRLEPLGTSSEVIERLDQLEIEMAAIEHESHELRVEDGPTLAGRAETDETETPAGMISDAVAEARNETKLKELVDEAVDKKAQALMAKRNKKPSMDVFAEVLELTDVQRDVAEREVVRGQREIWDILETPTADGATFMDELVDVMASGIATPGKDNGWGAFFTRVTTERIPGSDDTYAERIDAVKQTVRSSFRRDWSDEQYAEFESWEMDPTEIQGLDGSPWKALESRILERARALGADIPEKDDQR